MISGGRDARGATAEDLNPLQAELVDLLKAKPEGHGVSVVVNVGGQAKPEGKQSTSQAGYARDGEQPYVCGACRHYDGEDQTCAVVDGPYENGKVKAADTCNLWVPSASLIGGRK